MSRRAIPFPCARAMLHGMLDCANAHGSTGLLIVSGGNEIRAGSFAGQAHLADRLAEEAGVPVFRFDRRGVGDSEGENASWRGSRDDIAAALAAFRTSQPGLRRVIGFGTCDAASSLMLHAATLANGPTGGFDGLVLANPWTIDETVEDAEAITHSPQALRQRYLRRLADPRALLRLLTGRVNLGRLARGLVHASGHDGEQTTSALAALLHDSLAAFGGPTTILVAKGDRVGQRFLSDWPADDPRVVLHDSSSHSFANDEATASRAGDWLFERLIEATASRH
ncbi:esterase/lipase/thioesterase family protein [Novosphingobium nitrogenifigens DSM 19370]|uniref:Esterase/lipase/thioesterase family protein n=1 Tax=Novosphingobium nitrogenifigens DSM 19370 TaxID=983920 RepID=F1Z919_9SPHN|nr:hydrolase 1, exosortase A system-associated [Novosphingobium nitrogenifigens]EGD58961.1 esterase/lipase/thioesterase family protein [Novosphingobium nitrogenifigens DSM 19370]